MNKPKPDKYHQTNPPTELKSVVLGRAGSKKKTHGGARKGAGRPKTSTRVNLTVAIERENRDRFRDICGTENVSQAGKIEEWIENWEEEK